MKKIYLLLFAVLAVLQLSAQDRVTQIREKLMNRDQSSVIVVAHRCYNENTISDTGHHADADGLKGLTGGCVFIFR